MIDPQRLAARIPARTQRQLEGRVGIILSDNGDGTIEVDLAGTTLTVPTIGSVVVGNPVTLGVWDGNLIAFAFTGNCVSVTDYDGVIGGGVTEVSAALNAAFAAIAAAGKTACMPALSYYVTSSVIMKGSVVAEAGAEIITDQEITALVVGNGVEDANRSTHLWFQLPAVRQTSKKWTATGGSSPMTGTLGTDVGIKFRNFDSSVVFVPWVKNFSIGIWHAPEDNSAGGGEGQVYDKFFIGHLENNAVNQLIKPVGVNSWCNQNEFFGGRWMINSVGFPPVTNTRHCLLVSVDGGQTVGANQWYHPSMEGDTPEFHIRTEGVLSNSWHRAHLETADGIRIHFGDNGAPLGSRNNSVDTHSEIMQNCTVTEGTNSGRNAMSQNGMAFLWEDQTPAGKPNGLVRVSNYGASTEPFYTIYPAGVAPHNLTDETEWTMGLGATYLWGKATGDAVTVSRFRVDFTTGIVYLGTALVQVLEGTGSPEGVVTAPVGSLFLRDDGTSMYVKASGAGNTGWVVCWNAGNDGAGSGMDADTVDSLHASSFWQSAAQAGTVAHSHINTTTLSAANIYSGSTGNTFVQLSISRQSAKRDIRPLLREDRMPDYIDKWRLARYEPWRNPVLDLIPVRFRSIPDDERGRVLPYIGLIQEQVADVFPEAATWYQTTDIVIDPETQEESAVLRVDEKGEPIMERGAWDVNIVVAALLAKVKEQEARLAMLEEQSSTPKLPSHAT